MSHDMRPYAGPAPRSACRRACYPDGMPRRPAASSRAAVINIRLTPEERTFLAEQARLAGLTLSAYGRRRLLGHVVMAQADRAAIAELRRLGGLLKHIALERPEALTREERIGLLGRIGAVIDRIAAGRGGVS